MEDYFSQVEAEVRAAQRRDPDAVLPWSWWQAQGEQHGMSPNAVYTRAVKVGLDVPPAKRASPDREPASPAAEPTPVIPTGAREPARNGRPPERDPESIPNEPPDTASRSAGPRTPRPAIVPPPASGSLGDAIQNFAALFERSSRAEREVADLTRDLESARSEIRRLRRALRQADQLAAQAGAECRAALIRSDPEEDA